MALLTTTILPSLWPARSALGEAETPTPPLRPSEASAATATSAPAPTGGPLPRPRGALALYDARGREVLASAEDWERPRGGITLSQAEIVADPKGVFGRVARLWVRGYGRGEQIASVRVALQIPARADIVSIPVATALNGHVDETDSESALEIAVREPESGRTVWTYASHMLETELGAPYILAFADVSAFRGRKVELSIRLRQADVCAGSACTHDADAYLGDLAFERLPEVCTTQLDGRLRLYDYYEDPTPHQVDACPDPQPYAFLEVREGPSNAYGVGEDLHAVSFVLPEGAELLDFRLYYGRYSEGLAINGHSLSPEQVYAAFPVRLGTYVNIPEPSRYMPVNDNPEAVASLFRAGSNRISMTVSAQKPWEARPFDLYARFRVPSGSPGR